MTAPRGLSDSEAAAWARLAASVQPLHPARVKQMVRVDAAPAPSWRQTPAKSPVTPRAVLPRPSPSPPPAPPPSGGQPSGLDSHWERKLRAGTLAPDFTLDLHEHSLDAAYQRLLGGLDIARETGARVVLVIAGRARPAPAADRAGARGAIRAKLLDWLAASRHAQAIAAIRKAHRRHGGEGALYIVLKRPR